MSNEVIDAIRRVIPSRTKRSGTGFIDFNCPSCGDRRGRGGLLETPTGGFRYRCFNGGCVFEEVTGWEPGSPFVGRARRIFLDMGGDLSEISAELLTGRTRVFLPLKEWLEWMQDEKTALMMHGAIDIAYDFPETELPPKTQYLWDMKGRIAEAAKAYVLGRGDCFADYPFCWTPEYPKHVIVPFLHKNRIIGWIGRRFTNDKGVIHMKCQNWPTDYMLNQEHLHKYDMVLVVQGVFDAIAIEGLCSFGNVLTPRQVNLLNQSGKKIVLVPDYKGTEWQQYWQTAKDNHWLLSVPDWGGEDTKKHHIKDPGDAIKQMGLLATMQKLMSPKSITDNYAVAEHDCLVRSRGVNDDRVQPRRRS